MALDDVLRDLETAARDQLAAAWQLHVAKVEEQLRSGWNEHIELVVRERIHSLHDAMAKEAARIRRELTEGLNQAARRMLSAETTEEWKRVVEDAANGFCANAALFGIADAEVFGAPAFKTVVETKETVVALRAASELSSQVTERFGERPDGRCYLFPVIAAGDVRAVLYAEPGENGLDRNALELLAATAGSALRVRPPAGQLIQLPQTPVAPKKDDEEFHLRARRFARVRVAEMRLREADRVLRGRVQRDLYGSLKTSIDSGRAEYQSRFLENRPSMTDYFHEELVRTLANDDAGALGEGYPGELA